MTEQQPGTEIAGYRIESLIGRGGMAVVYRAEDTRLGRKVALKLLTPQLADNEQFRQRFIRESRLAASLDHPNIVPIFEAGEAGDQLFIAMRYVVGSDLKGVLADEGGRLPEGRTLRLFSQIADALDSAHRAGLVHRDVKPGNILVAAGSDQGRRPRDDHVYLTDFGLTKRTSELSGGLTGTGHFLGTVDFVSPEQIQGRPVGPGTDIYALGCVLYECLTGQLPFRRDDDAALLWAHLVEPPPPVTAIRPELPAAVNAVVARAMAKEPADRYASCEELVGELELALGLDVPVSGSVSRGPQNGNGAGRPDATPAGSGPSAPVPVAANLQPGFVEDGEPDRDDVIPGASHDQVQPVAFPGPETTSDDLPPIAVGAADAPPSGATGESRPSGSQRRRPALRSAVLSLLSLVLGAGTVLAVMPQSGKAESVVAERADSPGAYAFTEPPAPDAAASESAPASEVPTEDSGPTAGSGQGGQAGSSSTVVEVSGATVGLYGGSGSQVCD